MKKFLLTAMTALLLVFAANAQYQLIVMKKANVIKRFNTGDMIRYSLSTPKHFKYERIIELTQTEIITSWDTVPYYKVRLVDIEGNGEPSGVTLQKIGVYCVAAGVLLPIADLINVAIVQDDKYEIDSGVAITSASLVVFGVALMIIDKPYVKLQMSKRMMIVDWDSPLYKRQRTLPTSIPGN
jgi:hypothetical protein